MLKKVIFLVVIVIGLSGAAYYKGVTRDDVKGFLNRATHAGGKSAQTSAEELKSASISSKPVPKVWDGTVSVDSIQGRTIGLTLSKVLSQSEPMDLELLGMTGYDEARLIKVRSRFDTLVDSVLVAIGDRVTKGEPLVKLFSTELAEAKNAYRLKFLEWVLAKRVYDARQDLVKTGAVSVMQWVETQNTENKTRLERDVAANKLVIFKVSTNEIESLNQGLAADGGVDAHKVLVSDLASMTLRSPADGVVIERNVVPQNFYNEQNDLLVIAPLDHLYVWGNVYEADLDKVKVGQGFEVDFPFTNEKILTKVEYVSNQVDPDTHAVKIRASIPNMDGRLRAKQLVRVLLKIPAESYRTVIPRLAMITLNGDNYVFIAKKGKTDQFERRKIRIAQERHDVVIVESGIREGESVVSNGSLILSQLYEDLSSISSGEPSI